MLRFTIKGGQLAALATIVANPTERPYSSHIRVWLRHGTLFVGACDGYKLMRMPARDFTRNGGDEERLTGGMSLYFSEASKRIMTLARRHRQVTVHFDLSTWTCALEADVPDRIVKIKTTVFDSYPDIDSILNMHRTQEPQAKVDLISLGAFQQELGDTSGTLQTYGIGGAVRAVFLDQVECMVSSARLNQHEVAPR